MIYQFVTPANRDSHRGLMQDYFNRLAHIWGGNIALDNYDTQNASYVICTHPKFGVIGGLRLLPTRGPKLSDDSLIESGVALNDEKTWEATKLFFYLPDDDPINEDDTAFEDLCYEFYTSMWDYLRAICPVEMLVTLLPTTEHLDLTFFGQWPFILESTVSNPFDQEDEEYVLGVLRLAEEANYAIAG